MALNWLKFGNFCFDNSYQNPRYYTSENEILWNAKLKYIYSGAAHTQNKHSSSRWEGKEGGKKGA